MYILVCVSGCVGVHLLVPRRDRCQREERSMGVCACVCAYSPAQRRERAKVNVFVCVHIHLLREERGQR